MNDSDRYALLDWLDDLRGIASPQAAAITSQEPDQEAKRRWAVVDRIGEVKKRTRTVPAKDLPLIIAEIQEIKAQIQATQAQDNPAADQAQRESITERIERNQKEQAEAKRKADDERQQLEQLQAECVAKLHAEDRAAELEGKHREPLQIEAKVAPEKQQLNSTRRGPKRHEHTEFILGLWDGGERNREVIKRQFISQLPPSKRRTEADEEKLFDKWWKNAAKHRPKQISLAKTPTS